MAEHKQEETFKVIDRRLFTEEGELRKEVVEQERRDEEAAARKSAAHPQPPPQSKTGRPAQAAPPAAEAPGIIIGESAGTASAGAIEPLPNFQMLVDFLARNAAAMLGGMTDPRTGQPLVDLEGAREVIDMLDALREKTLGNLAKTDSDLLVEVIGSLKLTFMDISKAASEAMAKKAGAKK
ncbi:MAG: DUF1844 domain-containing protein [Candidatus Acidiferrales bacterium]